MNSRVSETIKGTDKILMEEGKNIREHQEKIGNVSVKTSREIREFVRRIVVVTLEFHKDYPKILSPKILSPKISCKQSTKISNAGYALVEILILTIFLPNTHWLPQNGCISFRIDYHS